MLKVLNAQELASISALSVPDASSGSGEGCASCLAHRPAPDPDTGHLTVDPEISLPSPLPMEIAYYYNSNDLVNSEYGLGRTISKKLTAVASSLPNTQTLVTLTRGNGQIATYLNSGIGFSPSTFGVINQLSTIAYAGSTYLQETTPDGLSTVFPYNTAGVATSIAYASDAVGNLHTFLYAPSGVLSGIQEGAGRLVSFLYASGTLQTIQDWAGRLTTFAYDRHSISGSALLTTVIGPSGCQTQYAYNGTGLLTGIVNPNGYATSYLYDGENRVVNRLIPAAASVTTYAYATGSQTIADALGHITTNLLGPSGAIVGIVNPLNQVTTIGISNGQIYSRQDPLSAVTTTNYDYNWNPLSTVDPLGRTTTYVRDSYGNATTIQYADGTVTKQLYGYAGSSFDTTGSKRKVQVSIDQLGNQTTYSYNSRGQKTAQKDPLGHVTSWVYDVLGNQTGMLNPLGNIWTNGYDAGGNTITAIDPLGNITSKTYDPQNRLVSKTDPLGNTSTYGYDSNGNNTIRIDPLGNRTTISYNVWNKPAGVQNPLGYLSTMAYDSLGRSVASVDPLANVSTSIYDPIGRMIASIDALGHATTLGYDLASRRVSTTNPLGYTNTTIYDLAGQAITEIDPLGDRTTSTYDLLGRRRAVIDPLGHVTTSIYDLAGQSIATQDALGHLFTSMYDRDSRVQSTIDPLGAVETTAYDAASRLIAGVNALGYATTAVYDAADRRVAAVNARGNISTTIYDTADRAVANQDARGNLTSFGYDADDRTIYTQDTLGHLATNIYDSNGRTIETLDALSVATTYGYDIAGRRIRMIDGLGHVVTAGYDALGRTVLQQDARGYATTIIYDAISRQIGVQDANGNRTSSLYDADNRLSASIDPLGNTTSYAYDKAGNQTLRVDARGYATTYSYDAINRQVGYVYPDASQVTYVYDAVSQQLAMQSSNSATGVTSMTYDLAGQVTSVTYFGSNPNYGAYGKQIRYSYDPIGDRSAMVDPDSGVTTYAYDPVSNVSSVVNPFAEATTFTYDALNRQTHRVLGNGAVISTLHDVDSRVVSVQAFTSATGSALSMFTYVYNAVGNALSRSELAGSVTSFTYDPSYQLLSEMRSGPNAYATTYTYDPLGNRLTKADAASGLTTYTYGAGNELKLIVPLSGPPTTVLYDPNGNQLIESTGGALTTYTWDFENRLAGVAYATMNPDTFTYLPDGRRAAKVTAGGGITGFAWDKQNVLLQLDDNANTRLHLTDALPGSWGELLSLRQSNTSSLIVPDAQTSIRQLLSAAQPPVATDAYSYKAFGEELLISGSTNNPFRYVGGSGYYRDYGTRLHVRARQLDVVKSRWIRRDLTSFIVKDQNLYRYLTNNPAIRTDGSGLWPTIYPIYGKYCGPQTIPGTGPGVNPLDECCRNHDDCWGTFKCTFPNGWFNPSPACASCNAALCACSNGFKCPRNDARCIAVMIAIQCTMKNCDTPAYDTLCSACLSGALATLLVSCLAGADVACIALEVICSYAPYLCGA